MLIDQKLAAYFSDALQDRRRGTTLAYKRELINKDHRQDKCDGGRGRNVPQKRLRLLSIGSSVWPVINS